MPHPMSWTFGIITSGVTPLHLKLQIESIRKLNLDKYQILIVGGPQISGKDIKHLAFDESQVSGWITKKKNLVARNADFENLIVAHDYIGFHQDWAAGFEIFGSDWDVCMTRVEDIAGRRFYDWVYWDCPDTARYSAVPYDEVSNTNMQFIPGGYFVTKTSFFSEHPLNESLAWGESEDVEWSLRVRSANYRMNPFSRVRHLKRHRGYRMSTSIYRDKIEFTPRPDTEHWIGL